MTEKEIFMMYIPQIAELVDRMSVEEYIAWKREVLITTPVTALWFIAKVFMVTDQIAVSKENRSLYTICI